MIIVTLFLLCLLMIGTASATDNDAIVGSNVTKDAVRISDNADNLESGQSDDVISIDEKTQPTSSSKETLMNVKSESQNEIDNDLKSTDTSSKLKDNNSMA